MGKFQAGFKSESLNDVSEPNTTQNLGSLQFWARIGQWFYLKFVSSSFESKTVKLPTFIVQTRFTCSRVNILNTLFSQSTECLVMAQHCRVKACVTQCLHTIIDEQYSQLPGVPGVWLTLFRGLSNSHWLCTRSGPTDVLHCEGLLLTNKLVFSALAPACSGLIREWFEGWQPTVSLLSQSPTSDITR